MHAKEEVLSFNIRERL